MLILSVEDEKGGTVKKLKDKLNSASRNKRLSRLSGSSSPSKHIIRSHQQSNEPDYLRSPSDMQDAYKEMNGHNIARNS